MDLAPGADPLGEEAFAAEVLRVRRLAARTERQRRVLMLGFHPVGNPHGLSLRQHPAAPPVADRDAPGPRCGDCAFRRLPNRRHQSPKCTRAPHHYRISRTGRGVGTNVASWWPGCVDWAPKPPEPGDTVRSESVTDGGCGMEQQQDTAQTDGFVAREAGDSIAIDRADTAGAADTIAAEPADTAVTAVDDIQF